MEKILGLIGSIKAVTGEFPCKKTVQKMVYLIQENGLDWGYDYSIHFYGPYSAELDSEIRYLHNCGCLNIDISSRGHTISVGESSHMPYIELEDAKKVIESFAMKSPSDLELLTTALYVQREASPAFYEDIYEGVKKIKGTKYSEAKIESAIYELVDKDYFKLAACAPNI